MSLKCVHVFYLTFIGYTEEILELINLWQSLKPLSQQEKTHFKVHLHIQFLHAFSTLRCHFLLLTLTEQNQDKL